MSFEKPFFEELILGHNSFFGVDHLSAQEGKLKDVKFSDVRRILPLIEVSKECGARGMMMSTHERAKTLAEELRRHPDLKDLSIYPLLPYAQKYVTAANEKGMLNVILDMLSGESASDKFKMVWNGTKGVLTKDLFSIIRNVIQIELKVFKGLNVRAIFLHDVFTDLILGLNLKEMVYFYYDEIEKNYNCKPAFATKNLPLLLSKFSEWGIHDPYVMPHVNKLGFWMNPSRALVEESLAKFPCHVMAMSTLASGHISPEEAFSYIGQLKTVESVVIGASKETNIRNSFSIASKYLINRN